MRKYMVGMMVVLGLLATQSLYALDATVMSSTDNYGCKMVTQDGQEVKMCYKSVKPQTLREQLQNTSWSILSLNSKNITSPGTLNFSSRTFTARLCNNLSGNFHVIQRSLILRNTISTMMYCDSDIMDVENAMNSANRSKLILNGDILIVRTPSGNVITWKKI